MRRLAHVVGGSIPPALGLILPRDALLLFLGAVAAIFIAVELARLFVEPFNRWLTSLFSPAAGAFKEAEAARPIGATYYVAGAFLSFLLFPRDAAVAALFFAAIGDVAAGVVGQRYGRTRLGRKSIEGTAGFLVAALAVGAILLLAGLRLTWAAVLVGALVAALTKLLPIPTALPISVPLLGAASVALVMGMSEVGLLSTLVRHGL